MDHQALVPDLIRALYEGSSEPQDEHMADDMFFSDPLVRVRGRAKVARMFRRLNGFFAATKVVTLNCEEQRADYSRWSFDIDYARKEGAKPIAFHSHLEVTSRGGQIQSITEHWHQPYELRGGTKGLIPRWMRATAGWVVS